MNREKMQQVRDDIAAAPDNKFNMADWAWEDEDEDCGTVMCIAGFACIAGGAKIIVDDEDNAQFFVGVEQVDAEVFGTEVLGLADRQSERLFYGQWSEKARVNITKEETLDYLDRCIKVGAVVA